MHHHACFSLVIHWQIKPAVAHKEELFSQVAKHTKVETQQVLKDRLFVIDLNYVFNLDHIFSLRNLV